ncbi:lysophospholipase L1-like esterase [Ruminiclostridium sufflavum DSM 19573]|uniref:cellulase n=1 Tax=Ruminiclostridium sufflavum DSM 19573 TaxID=1121337 RepID=A0A318XN73_9FIRM|nr:GDSL-type esterase/lipase family protein [Ruminiclostridium sufflavum]PYG88241.1 lysophospholipase L1-like esterase [Ruminiclostridium sufflavum DSM 19573]
MFNFKKRVLSLLVVLSLCLSVCGAVNFTAAGASAAQAGTIVYGDCNSDGSIDALDFALFKQYLINPGQAFNGSMDLNLDNAIDAVDFAIMKKYLLGIIDKLPEGDIPVASNEWVGTWGTSPQLTESSNMPPSPGLSNNTLRQIVRVSIGGDQLRLRLSNQYGNSAVSMNSVHMAVSAGGSSIQAGTDKVLTFGGKESVTIQAGKTVISDTIDFNLNKLTNVAVTIYFGDVPSALTGHPGSRTTSYIQSGNAVNSSSMPSAVKTEHWYIITGIDVFTEEAYDSVAILGDSITDGRGSTTDANNRWTDVFAARLLDNAATSKVSMLNMGVGGNAVLTGGLGPTALTRFDRDILEQSGVKYAIVFEGVNDIGAGAASANLINAYKQFIDKAHAKNILVYGATITPIGSSQYASGEQARTEVNNWIRTSGQFDAVIDFDAAVRDPNNQKMLQSSYDSGDHLHLSPAGYKKMAEIIDLSLFTK